MSLRVVVNAVVAFCVLLLPLVCLCGLVPGQGDRAPYLLLFPRPHGADVETLTDDQLAELAATTGQAVTITDDGQVTFGYAEDGTVAWPGTGLSKSPLAPDQNPQLDAIVPQRPPHLIDGGKRSAAGRAPLALAQYTPEPPTAPPRLA
jgi:hypothetical protein